jgi:hypothetical protein
MKRYLLFGGENYYPGGGWHDFKGSYPTREEAQAAGKALTSERYQWFHVIDLENPPDGTP